MKRKYILFIAFILTVSCGKQQDDNLGKQFNDQTAEGDKIYHQKIKLEDDFQMGCTAIYLRIIKEPFTCDPDYKKGNELFAEFDELEKNILNRANAINKGYGYEFQKKIYQARSDLKSSISNSYSFTCANKKPPKLL